MIWLEGKSFALCATSRPVCSRSPSKLHPSQSPAKMSLLEQPSPLLFPTKDHMEGPYFPVNQINQSIKPKFVANAKPEAHTHANHCWIPGPNLCPQGGHKAISTCNWHLPYMSKSSEGNIRTLP